MTKFEQQPAVPGQEMNSESNTPSWKRKKKDATGRIMICEDDMVTAKIIETALEKEGYTVSLATSAELAEAMLEDEPFEVLVLDLNLPGMNGLKLIDDVRAGQLNGNARIMVYSGRTGLRDISLCFRQGANAYVAKPAGPKILLEVIDRLRKGEDRMVRLSEEVKKETSPLEVRRFERYPVQASLARLRRETETTARTSATMEDVSVEGVKVRVKQPFGLGEHIYLRCQLFQPFEFEVPYEIVHVCPTDNDEYTLGLRLSGDVDRLRPRLARIVQRHVPVSVPN